MASELERTVGNVKLEARSNSIPDKDQPDQYKPDEQSEYIVTAHVPGTHLSWTGRFAQPGSAEAALDLAARDPWVVEHSGLPG